MAIGGVQRERVSTGTAASEAAAFAAALESAIADLSSLIERTEGEGADILAFQVAMLEDDALLLPARAMILSGKPADEAWRKTVDAEIVGYELSDDDYFRARAADLKDMRDRVLKHLAGEGAAAFSPGAILVGEDIPPTLFLEADWTKGGGIALTQGSASSHVAMLARARGVPMVVGLGDIALNGHSEAVIDG
ncbi:MAG: phosphoenolpyruvate-utilizing N-terminal domain-containing protein, partial [Parvibaculaceae bacterium]